MSSIGSISAFGSQAVTNRFQKSTSPKVPTVLEAAEKLRTGPVGKSEQTLHLEKSKEMARAGKKEESLHEKVTRESAQEPDKHNLHLALMEKRNSEPVQSLGQKNTAEGITSAELAQGVADRNAKVAASNSKASQENAQKFGSAFDTQTPENMAKKMFNSGNAASGYEANGQARYSSALPVGGVLNTIA